MFCSNNLIAIGAIKVLHMNNIKIPDDIEVIGFNNIPMSRYIYPSLSTINVDMTPMAQEVVNLTLKGINNHNYPVRVVIPTKLIHRESTDVNLI